MNIIYTIFYHTANKSGGKFAGNILCKQGILTSSSEICKDKNYLVARAVTQPFAEMVWVSTGKDMEIINRLTDILISMNTPTDREKLFRIIQILYGLLGLQFSEEAAIMTAQQDTLDYFLFSFIVDFGEIINDYLVEESL